MEKMYSGLGFNERKINCLYFEELMLRKATKGADVAQLEFHASLKKYAESNSLLSKNQ